MNKEAIKWIIGLATAFIMYSASALVSNLQDGIKANAEVSRRLSGETHKNATDLKGNSVALEHIQSTLDRILDILEKNNNE